MPFYKDIDKNTGEGQRILNRLLMLRKELDAKIPVRTLNDTLLLATWNIREFDSKAYGDRIPESYYYIAEIIDRFDLVAIQEVREDLKALKRLRSVLGGFWKYLVTDVTEGRQGNNERMAFLYDSRTVRFGGLAGEIALPPIAHKNKGYEPVLQFARTPYICGFTSGWARFMLSTVHILYGESKPDDPRRIKEIKNIAQFLKKRSLEATAWAKNLIILGDFNIFSPGDSTMKALLDAGFTVPAALQSLPSNLKKDKHYDQIAFRVQPGRLESTGKSGVFDFCKTVFRDEDEKVYIPSMGSAYLKTKKGQTRSKKGKTTYYRSKWRTYQMSDHLPMWVELKINYSEEYLKSKLIKTG